MIEKIIEHFTKNNIELRKTYNTDDFVNLVISIENSEKLHPNASDYNFTISIQGQILTDTESAKERFETLKNNVEKILDSMTAQDIDVTGAVYQGMDVNETETELAFDCTLNVFVTDYYYKLGEKENG